MYIYIFISAPFVDCVRRFGNNIATETSYMVMMGCRKGPWTAEEDKLLTEYVNSHGEGRWTSVAKSSGLNRNGKSCRLRWVNYLRPGLKRSQLTTQEESIIIELHALWGNKWSTISKYLPGRTDNEIKNYWRTYLRHKEKYPEIQEKQKNQILTSQRRQLQVPADLGRILSQPENDHGMVCKGQGKDQENVFIYPNLELEDQCLSVIFQDGGVPPRSDTMGEEGTLWGSLWNLNDARVHHTFNNNKIII